MSVVLFAQAGLLSAALGRPIKILFLTSLRDIALCDCNGKKVNIPGGWRYMEGVVEHTVRQTLPGGVLHSVAEVVGVVTDDLAKDLAGYPAVPTRGRPWIHPLDLARVDGKKIAHTTFNVASYFRALPMNDRKARSKAKLIFEGQVDNLVRRLGADVLVSDHYMARIEHLHLWLPGRVLNIHPGITLPDHLYRFPGKTPTADAISRAGREAGVRTGATLHFVDSEIDHGPVIAYSEATRVYGTDGPRHLRYRNYRTAKLPVFTAGLAHYAASLYPYLNQLDRSRLAPLSG